MRVLQYRQRPGWLGDQQKSTGRRGGGHEGRAGPSRELSWPTVGLAWPARGKAGPAASKHREEGSNGDSSPEKKKEMEIGQSVMDSCNRIYHGVEKKEIYLWVVVVVTVTRRFGRKNSPEVRRKPSLFRTSASDPGGYG